MEEVQKKGGKIYATMSKTHDDTLQKWNLKMGRCDFSDYVREHCAASTNLSVLWKKLRNFKLEIQKFILLFNLTTFIKAV